MNIEHRIHNQYNKQAENHHVQIITVSGRSDSNLTSIRCWYQWSDEAESEEAVTRGQTEDRQTYRSTASCYDMNIYTYINIAPYMIQRAFNQAIQVYKAYHDDLLHLCHELY
jgi:hypothetical protein